MIKRRKTRTVTVGGVPIGSDHPVVVQSMAKTGTSDVDATVGQILRLEAAGCEMVRVAVKDIEDARAISAVKDRIGIPLIADIHFDYTLALEAVERGADKIRINPGNITKAGEIDSVIDAVSGKKIPVRIGVNSGSLMEVASGEGDPADAMVGALARYIERFSRRGFNDIIISLKSSDVATTVEAYRKMAAESDLPFHLGVTAAGSPEHGIVKSSVGIGTLLMEGIGDTIRVSLTGDPVQEVATAREILASAGLKNYGPEVIACPTCGRCRVDLVPIVKELEAALKRDTRHGTRDTGKQLVIAVMGCEVNGPGEAKAADIGIAFGKGKGAIFRHGEIVRTVEAGDSVKELLRMIREEI